ncbi:proton channel OtopLc [Procambarus clarkii]|uniref:proton channel OtopLc n=1 Tax=Procambarus clarkii TaxID=6728 RepID=UPI00374265F9
MDSTHVGHSPRDPKTFTGLSKRAGAVSHIAKSFENVERSSSKDSGHIAKRSGGRNEPQKSDSFEGVSREPQPPAQQGFQRHDPDRASERHMRRQQRPHQQTHAPQQQQSYNYQQQQQQQQQQINYQQQQQQILLQQQQQMRYQQQQHHQQQQQQQHQQQQHHQQQQQQQHQQTHYQQQQQQINQQEEQRQQQQRNHIQQQQQRQKQQVQQQQQQRLQQQHQQQQQQHQQQQQQQLQHRRQQEELFRSQDPPRESYKEPADSIHLPRPTVSNRLLDVHQSYDEPKSDPEISSPLKNLANSQGKLYFGSGFRNIAGVSEKPPNHQTGLLKNLMSFTPKLVRGPTLGELMRGDIITSSNRSSGVPNPGDPQASTSRNEAALLDKTSVKNAPQGKSFSEQNLSPSRRSTTNISQMVSRDPIVHIAPRAGRGAGKPPTPIPQRSARIVSPRRPPSLMQTNINKDKNIVRTAEPLNRLDNNSCVRTVVENERVDHTYDLDVVLENGDSSSSEIIIENDAPSVKAYPDHPERDSLDGHLPGSSHGTGNPPPPPTPPSPPAASTKPTGGAFTKGPNAKNKKHKKLKNESDESSIPGGELPEKEKPKKEKLEKSSKDRDMEAGGGYRPKTEPYTYLWVVMSGMYGKLVVLLMLAFCLTEVLDNTVLPFTFQGVFLMYLYVGSIVAIMCIYVSVIIDNCPSITASKENLTKHEDPEVGSITSFGTLKRAHISRSKTSRTSFYLRVGALVFGLGTLIFNGLEIAMHSTMKSECVKDIVFAHPILQALFTFLQMHFLFVNSEVIVEKFGQVARFGFMHLVATNIAIWIRMVVWESATVWIEDTYAYKPAGEVPQQAEQVLRLYSCFQNNTLGRLWTDAQPYLFPFLVQYSLIAAAVTYIMWCNVGKEKLKKLGRLGKTGMEDSATLDKRCVRKGYWKVDCRSASKGLFLGLLCLVGGVVILIIFFVMKDQEDFKTKMFWMCNGTQMIILSLSIICSIIGFLQIPKLSISTTKPLDLDRLLLSSTIIGVYVFAVFGMIVGGINYTQSEYMATFCVHGLLFVQVSLQDMLVAEASRRTCSSRYQMLTKPGRQVITFLLFANITLWILDTFMTHTSVSQQFQFGFYGVLAWGIISRISLPLLILYRFHSAVILVEIWKNTYRTKAA